MGLFSYLLVLGCWELERFAKQYTLVHRSAIHLEVFLKKIFENMAKFPKMILSKHSTFIILTRAVSAFNPSYNYKAFVELKGRIRTGHTCIPYIVKLKRGSTEKKVLVCGWMDEWWYGLPLRALVLSLKTSLSSLFFETWLPLSHSVFFGSCFFGMPSFLFLGQP